MASPLCPRCGREQANSHYNAPERCESICFVEVWRARGKERLLREAMDACAASAANGTASALASALRERDEARAERDAAREALRKARAWLDPVNLNESYTDLACEVLDAALPPSGGRTDFSACRGGATLGRTDTEGRDE